MVNKEVLTYISAEMDRGTAREVIEKNLKDNGWDANDLKEAFSLVSNVNAEVPASASFRSSAITQAPAPISVLPSNANLSDTRKAANENSQIGISSNPMGGLGGFAPEVAKMADINPVPAINPSAGITQAKPMTQQFAQSSKPLPSFSGMSMGGVNPSPAQNFASVKPTAQPAAKSGGIMGYVWTALIFLLLGAGGGFFASRNLFPNVQPAANYAPPPVQTNLPPVQNSPVEPVAAPPVLEGASATTTTNPGQSVCAQVITKAKDPKTYGEVTPHWKLKILSP